MLTSLSIQVSSFPLQLHRSISITTPFTHGIIQNGRYSRGLVHPCSYKHDDNCPYGSCPLLVPPTRIADVASFSIASPSCPCHLTDCICNHEYRLARLGDIRQDSTLPPSDIMAPVTHHGTWLPHLLICSTFVKTFPLASCVEDGGRWTGEYTAALDHGCDANYT